MASSLERVGGRVKLAFSAPMLLPLSAAPSNRNFSPGPRRQRPHRIAKITFIVTRHTSTRASTHLIAGRGDMDIATIHTRTSPFLDEAGYPVRGCRRCSVHPILHCGGTDFGLVAPVFTTLSSLLGTFLPVPNLALQTEPRNRAGTQRRCRRWQKGLQRYQSVWYISRILGIAGGAGDSSVTRCAALRCMHGVAFM